MVHFLRSASTIKVLNTQKESTMIIRLWISMLLVTAIGATEIKNQILFPSVLSASNNIILDTKIKLKRDRYLTADSVVGKNRCRYRAKKRCIVQRYQAVDISPLPNRVSKDSKIEDIHRYRLLDSKYVPSIKAQGNRTKLLFRAPMDSETGRKVQYIGDIIDHSSISNYIFYEGDYYIDSLQVESSSSSKNDIFRLHTKGVVRIFLKNRSYIIKRDDRYRRKHRALVSLNSHKSAKDLLIVAQDDLVVEASRRVMVRGFILGYKNIDIRGNRNSKYIGAIHAEGDLHIGYTDIIHPKQRSSGRFIYAPKQLSSIDLSFTHNQPPSIEIPPSATKLHTPYSRITLEVNTTSTVKLVALNQTLADEQNRSIELKGVDNNGTFYLYNVPLIKGANTIRLQATNEADEMVEQNITVDADANLTLSLAMRATVYEGVQSLDTTVEVGTVDLNVTEYLFDVEADGKIDTIENDANFTVHLTDERRYRPRVTVRTKEGLLYSSDAYALSLDVKATAQQKDPKWAEPIDIAKEFVQALIEDDRDKMERFFLYSGSRWIRMLYEDDARRASMREKLRNINEADWSQVYHPSGAATVTTTVHDSSTNQDIPIGFELTPVSFDGIPRGRMWFIRAFY